MAPRNGMATIEKIAINAVMAGARPEYLPVIIAAIECVTEKCFFHLYHLVNSAGSPVPVIWVNGPIAEEIGMNSGTGYLGHGNRANNTIGRAIGMCMINIGWREAYSGYTGDPAIFCNFTFAENEKENPWESFAVGRGFKPGDSTVTVNETMQFNRFGPGGGMSSQTLEQSLDAILRMFSGWGGGSRRMLGLGSAYELALHPTLAKQLTEAGFTKQSLVKWICEKTGFAWDPLSKEEKDAVKTSIRSGLISDFKPEDCKPGAIIPTIDKERVAILVAGGAACNTVLWSGLASTWVSPDLAGSVQGTPPPFMTKAIRGATLTKAGR
jgi:hypothetical protein